MPLWIIEVTTLGIENGCLCFKLIQWSNYELCWSLSVSSGIKALMLTSSNVKHTWFCQTFLPESVSEACSNWSSRVVGSINIFANRVRWFHLLLKLSILDVKGGPNHYKTDTFYIGLFFMYFAALRDAGKQSINSDWKIEHSGTFNIAGTTVHYVRRGLWEKISAKGPTTSPLHLLVWQYGLVVITCFLSHSMVTNIFFQAPEDNEIYVRYTCFYIYIYIYTCLCI